MGKAKCELQVQFKCCGWNNLTDHNPQTPPNTTVSGYDCLTMCEPEDPLRFNRTCESVIEDDIKKYSKPVAIAAIVIALLELLGILTGMCLCCGVRTMSAKEEAAQYLIESGGSPASTNTRYPNM